jgi:TetR/AcrR family transcriptional repressor of nem operon
MARPKAFDEGDALDAAIGVFREHGFEGSSSAMLVEAMGIGRQSLYDTFGDKWQLYRAAVRRYDMAEASAHATALRAVPRAIDGLRAMIDRVVTDAHLACLGVSSTCEFGRSRADLTEIHDAAAAVIGQVVATRLREAQADGDIARDIQPEDMAVFLTASIAGIRIAARGGASEAQLAMLGALALRALQ